MPKFDWNPFRSIDFLRLSDVRELLLQALQPISAVARKFAKNDDYKNDHLIWVPGLTRMAGKWVEGNTTFRVSIGLTDFKVYLVDRQVNTIAAFDLQGKSQSQLLIWLEEQIGLFGLDASGLTMNLPYKLADHSVQHGGVYDIHTETLLELSKYFNNAYIALKDLETHWKLKETDLSIAPKNMAQSTRVVLKETGDEATNTALTAGMYPGGAQWNEPFFYIHSKPHVDISNLPPLSGGGRWVETTRTGAQLVATHMINKSEQEDDLFAFYLQASSTLGDALIR